MDELASEARVLVAVVTRPCDLARAREQGWYRIPLAHAPPSLHAEYLAFYQTAAFGAERWAVRYYAEVREVSVRTRLALLPGEPNHPRAAARYYRFALGPMQALALPITSRRLRRICFIPTTVGQLLHAHDVAELWQPAGTVQGWDTLWGAGVNQHKR